mmetsp:Transcript_96665/g.171173  ORF Transcript_96665/g.171173 Transcript_96665/m.171173 type:complete len:210 (+) Transcript_96665:53-682(+)
MAEALPENAGDATLVSASDESATAASKVAQSIQEKGANSYYFAHAKPREDLSEAKQIEGDGQRRLADNLGGPARVEEVDAWLAEGVQSRAAMEKVKWREDYAWGDEDKKVKVYVEFPDGILGRPDTKVEADFGSTSFKVLVRGDTGVEAQVMGITNGEHPLAHEIVPEQSSYRISSNKTRLTITLKKKDPAEAWTSLKKKVISQHTGWN